MRARYLKHVLPFAAVATLAFTSHPAQAQIRSLSQRQLPVVHTKAVLAVAFSTDGKLLASSSRDGTVRIWDVAQRHVVRTLQLDSSVTSVAFSPDGTRFAAVTNKGEVRQWDARTWAPGTSFTLSYKWLTAVAYSRPMPATSPVTLSRSRTMRTLLAVAGPERVRIFDAGTPSGTPPLVGEIDLSHFSSAPDAFTMYVDEITFAPDGRTLATGGRDHRVRLWDTRTWQQKLEMMAPHPAGIAFTPNGAAVASAGDNFATLWDANTGNSIRHFDVRSAMAVAMTPDGKTFAVAKSDTIRVFDVATGTLKRMLGEMSGAPGSAGYFISSLAFSPDGSLLAAGSYDKAVRLYNATARLP